MEILTRNRDNDQRCKIYLTLTLERVSYIHIHNNFSQLTVLWIHYAQ